MTRFYTENLGVLLDRLKGVLCNALEHAWHEAERRPKWKSRMMIESFAEHDECGWIKISTGKNRKARLLECRRVGDKFQINIHIEGDLGFRRRNGCVDMGWRDVSFKLQAGSFNDRERITIVDTDRLVKNLMHYLLPQPWRGTRYFNAGGELANI